MSQLQLEIIAKVLVAGAPALANELINSLNDVLTKCRDLEEENGRLVEEIKFLQSTDKESNSNNSVN